MSSLSPVATATLLTVSWQLVWLLLIVQLSAVAAGPPPGSLLRVKVTLFPPPGATSRRSSCPG